MNWMFGVAVAVAVGDDDADGKMADFVVSAKEKNAKSVVASNVFEMSIGSLDVESPYDRKSCC